jgi:hypothetical protein
MTDLSDWPLFEQSMINTAQRYLGRRFTQDELDMIPERVTPEALHELVQALRAYDAENVSDDGADWRRALRAKDER